MRAAILISDGVVTIRDHRPEDAEAVVVACQDPQIARWIPIPQPYTHDSYREWIESAEANRAAGRTIELIVADTDDRPVGAIGLKELDREPGYGEIGYWIAAAHRGKGYAARAVRLLRGWAREELGLRRFELLIHPDNVASQVVARAAGFEATGEYRMCPRGCTGKPDHLVFAEA